MIKRTISTLSLWAILVLAVYFGRAYGFGFLMFMLAIAAGWETCAILKKLSLAPSFPVYCAATALLFASIFCPNPVDSLILSLAIIFIGFSFWMLKDPYSGFFKKTLLPTFMTILVVSFMLFIYASIGRVNISLVGLNWAGIIFAIWGIGAAKFCDTGGYLFGVVLGKHKMAPSISPKKSWEGAIGGIFLSMVFSALVAWGFSKELPEGFTPLYAALWSIAISIVSIVSDLLESVLKRRADIKDSGRTIPGIGGALDLADSMLLPAPLVLIALMLV